MHNLSVCKSDETAKTNTLSAFQRAENIAILNAKSILELCVGPSLKNLMLAYSGHDINVTGNDIDARWRKFYPSGNWIIGNCFDIDYRAFDCVVFAPPLSRGCTGKREDSLSIDDVNPSYYKFLDKIITDGYHGNFVLVLPARSIATSQDRSQLHRLRNHILATGISITDQIPLRGKRDIVKYVDLYCSI